ncbi:hypothetical protein NFI96_030600 [Prochilodus magdalenae]|nr:hypothetical protein NFI96_030600 [Prochilodus magdalenae]
MKLFLSLFVLHLMLLSLLPEGSGTKIPVISIPSTVPAMDFVNASQRHVVVTSTARSLPGGGWDKPCAKKTLDRARVMNTSYS